MTPQGAPTSPSVLNSWKEIAAYLGRDVRTVMRWEQTRGLPVHRLPGEAKSAVFAVKSEIDGWRRGRKLTLLDVPEQSDSEMPAVEPAAPHRRPRVAVLALGCLLVAGTGAAVAWRILQKPAGTPTFPIVRLTYDHSASAPTISADASLFAYTSDRDGKFDIYVQHIGDREPIRVTRNEADNVQPNFSPDGSHIAFRSDRDGGGLYLVPSLGGIERKIADRGAYPAFSPVGASILYLVRIGFSGRARMFIIGLDGGSPRPFQPEFEVAPTGTVFSIPMWSPDGKFIIFEGVSRSDKSGRSLWVAPAAGGPVMAVGQVPPVPTGKIRIYTGWAGNYLYYVEGTSVHGAPLMRTPVAPNPWRIAGPPEMLTTPSTVCGLARVSPGGRIVMTIAGTFVNNIWSVPLQANSGVITGQPRQETPDAYNQMRMSVAANGSRLAYVSYLAEGHLEIRLMDVATRRLASIPLSSANRSPFFRLRPDGSRLAYRDLVNGKLVSYSVPAADPSANAPVCEGCSVVGFFSRSDDEVLAAYGPRLVRQSLSTGARKPLIDFPINDPALSPDDHWLAFVAPNGEGSAGLFIAPVRDEAVPPSEWMLVSEDPNYIGSPQWSPQGQMLYYISNRDSFSCVWAQSFDAARKTFGNPMHVYHDRAASTLKASPGRSIAITPDRLYLMMATMASNIWMMETGRR